MTKRPLSVTIIACLLAAAGFIGLVYHLKEFKPQHPFQYEIIWITLVRLLAIVGGVYMLRGKDWARWLALAWMTFHVVVSAFHSTMELAMHSLLLAIFAYFLLRRPAAEYFRGEPRTTA
jgi:hypothetical protein